MGDADEANVFAFRTPPRLQFRAQPMPASVSAAVARFEHEGLQRTLPRLLLTKDSREIVGMQRVAPIKVHGLVVGDAEKILISAVDEIPPAAQPRHPHRHWRAVGDRAEALLALGQNSFGELARGHVLNHAIHANDAPAFIMVRNVHDFRVYGLTGAHEVGFVGDGLSRQRAGDERLPSREHIGVHQVFEPSPDDLGQRPPEPGLVRFVGEAECPILVDVRDQDRQRIGDGAKPSLAGNRGLFGASALGDIQVRADQFHGASLAVALDLRNRPHPTHLAVAWTNNSVFLLVVCLLAR